MKLIRINSQQLSDKAATYSLIATAVLLVISGILSYGSTQHFLDNDGLVEHTYQVIDADRAVLSDVKDAETGQRGYLLTGNSLYLQPYYSGTRSIAADMQTLTRLTRSDVTQQGRIRTITTLIAEKNGELATTISVRKRHGLNDTLKIVNTGRGQFLMEQIRLNLSEMQTEERDRLELRTRDAERSGIRITTILLSCFLTAVCLVGIATAFVLHYLSQRRRAEHEIRLINRDLENRVEARTRLLEDANKELEAFSYSVSHDLRAPLRHISGFAELLEKRTSGHLDENGQRYVATIRNSAQHAGNLVDDLLTFSRMGRTELRSTSVDLNRLIDEVRNDMAIDLDQRGIEWNIQPLPPVEGDAAMLRLVFQNLIGNGVKYTKNREHAVIEIGCEPRADENVFFIRDNGVGFDMRYVDKLFGVFQRLHRSEEFDGTGIGLANVRRIITRHGGRTWAQGEVDKGATIYFSLPANKFPSKE